MLCLMPQRRGNVRLCFNSFMGAVGPDLLLSVTSAHPRYQICGEIRKHF